MPRVPRLGGILLYSPRTMLNWSWAGPASFGQVVRRRSMRRLRFSKSGEAAESPIDMARRQGMNISQQPFGATAEGKAVDLYTLDNGRGMKVSIMTYGCILTAVEAPDRTGKPANVTLYLDTLKDYLAGHPMFGAVVGRVAGRIGGAKFTLDGKE
jgi:hypothetical protein